MSSPERVSPSRVSNSRPWTDGSASTGTTRPRNIARPTRPAARFRAASTNGKAIPTSTVSVRMVSEKTPTAVG